MQEKVRPLNRVDDALDDVVIQVLLCLKHKDVSSG